MSAPFIHSLVEEIVKNQILTRGDKKGMRVPQAVVRTCSCGFSVAASGDDMFVTLNKKYMAHLDEVKQ